jgi:glycerophosphoryl diester phosphodiesterase
MARHKCFISYHHDDQNEIDTFVRTFDHDRDVFIARGLGQEMSDDIIISTNTDYVLKRIRELYLKDSTVTIVLMGKCTWARRYVDWEIQATLRSGEMVTPNGLLGIKLPSYPKSSGQFPNRLNLNLKQNDSQEDCYARWIEYPFRKDSLSNAIEDAFQRRSTHKKWINNPRDRFSNNRSCS